MLNSLQTSHLPFIFRINKCCKSRKRELNVLPNQWNLCQKRDYFGGCDSNMVVPSEKNTDIIDLSMEQVEYKDSALKTLSNISEKEPLTEDKLVERDKSCEVENEDEAKSGAKGSSSNHIPADTIFSPVTIHSKGNSDAEMNRSESALSLNKSDQDDEVNVLGDDKSVARDSREEISDSVLGDKPDSTNNSILEPEAECG